MYVDVCLGRLLGRIMLIFVVVFLMLIMMVDELFLVLILVIYVVLCMEFVVLEEKVLMGIFVVEFELRIVLLFCVINRG